MLTTLLLAVMCLATSGRDAVSFHVITSPTDIEVRLELDRDTAIGLRDAGDDARKTLSLFVAGNEGKTGPAVFADYRWSGDTLVLRPRYRLTPGVTYVARARLPDGTLVERTHFVTESPKRPAPRVRTVFPSSQTLPANCLKFYVHFSEPMRQGRRIFEQIHLEDERGRVIPDPWRRTELWNAEGDRLTIWIHPGRIKQGVNLREEFGPVLRPNRRYRLVITNQLQGLGGQAIERPYVKEFMAREEDHRSPDPGRWKLGSIRAGTRVPLLVSLDEPLDHALLNRLVRVVSADNQVAGSIAVHDAETTWTFTPDEPWPTEPVFLLVDERLEDLAGNTPVRVFDTDLTRGESQRPTLQLAITKLSNESAR